MANGLLTIGQIGLGHWGPNLLRNFLSYDGVQVKLICDKSPEKLAKASRFKVPATANSSEILAAGNGIDAVVIATPVASHFALVQEALNNGKHVFVEKPLTADPASSQALVELARKKQLVLMVGHVFLYNDGIRYVRSLIQAGELGRIMLIHAQRTNLGPVREDVDALWDLAPHDISIFNYWLGSEPVAVTAHGSRVLGKKQDDVVHASFVYPNNVTCQVLASWVHPNKIRQITVVGDRRMLVWDDMNSMEPVRIFDKGIQTASSREQRDGSFAEFQFTIRDGDIRIPHVNLSQPLNNECLAFLEAVRTGKQLLSDGAVGLAVVKALAAADESRRQESRLVKIGAP